MAKPDIIEGFADLYLIRPAGFILVQGLKKMSVTPNMVSLWSVLAAWCGAYTLYQISRYGPSAGWIAGMALFMLLHSALDSADGQLARATQKTSLLGRSVDGFCDNLSFMGIYIAILFGCWMRTGVSFSGLFLLALAAGFSHSLQSSLTDWYRQLFLYYVQDKKCLQDEDLEDLNQKRFEGNGQFKCLLLFLHRNYVRRQRKFAGSSFHLLKETQKLWLKDPKGREAFTSLYETIQKSSMPWWAILGPNTHKAAILIAGCLPVTHSSLPGSLGLIWYWLFELLILNVLMIHMMHTQKKRDNLLRLTNHQQKGKVFCHA